MAPNLKSVEDHVAALTASVTTTDDKLASLAAQFQETQAQIKANHEEFKQFRLNEAEFRATFTKTQENIERTMEMILSRILSIQQNPGIGNFATPVQPHVPINVMEEALKKTDASMVFDKMPTQGTLSKDSACNLFDKMDETNPTNLQLTAEYFETEATKNSVGKEIETGAGKIFDEMSQTLIVSPMKQSQASGNDELYSTVEEVLEVDNLLGYAGEAMTKGVLVDEGVSENGAYKVLDGMHPPISVAGLQLFPPNCITREEDFQPPLNVESSLPSQEEATFKQDVGGLEIEAIKMFNKSMEPNFSGIQLTETAAELSKPEVVKTAYQVLDEMPELVPTIQHLSSMGCLIPNKAEKLPLQTIELPKIAGYEATTEVSSSHISIQSRIEDIAMFQGVEKHKSSISCLMIGDNGVSILVFDPGGVSCPLSTCHVRNHPFINRIMGSPFQIVELNVMPKFSYTKPTSRNVVQPMTVIMQDSVAGNEQQHYDSHVGHLVRLCTTFTHTFTQVEVQGTSHDATMRKRITSITVPSLSNGRSVPKQENTSRGAWQYKGYFGKHGASFDVTTMSQKNPDTSKKEIRVQCILNREKGMGEVIFTGSDLIDEGYFSETTKGCGRYYWLEIYRAEFRNIGIPALGSKFQEQYEDGDLFVLKPIKPTLLEDVFVVPIMCVNLLVSCMIGIVLVALDNPQARGNGNKNAIHALNINFELSLASSQMDCVAKFYSAILEDKDVFDREGKRIYNAKGHCIDDGDGPHLGRQKGWHLGLGLDADSTSWEEDAVISWMQIQHHGRKMQLSVGYRFNIMGGRCNYQMLVYPLP